MPCDPCTRCTNPMATCSRADVNVGGDCGDPVHAVPAAPTGALGDLTSAAWRRSRVAANSGARTRVTGRGPEGRRDKRRGPLKRRGLGLVVDLSRSLFPRPSLEVLEVARPAPHLSARFTCGCERDRKSPLLYGPPRSRWLRTYHSTTCKSGSFMNCQTLPAAAEATGGGGRCGPHRPGSLISVPYAISCLVESSPPPLEVRLFLHRQARFIPLTPAGRGTARGVRPLVGPIIVVALASGTALESRAQSAEPSPASPAAAAVYAVYPTAPDPVDEKVPLVRSPTRRWLRP